MTEPTEAISILAEHIAMDGILDTLEDEISMFVGEMNNSQHTRDRAGLEPDDEFPEPQVLGLIVNFADEAHIVWSPAIDSLNDTPVILADLMRDVQAEAQTAYSHAAQKLHDSYTPTHPTTPVINGRGRIEDRIGELEDDFVALLDRFADTDLPFAVVIGVIETVKQNLIISHSAMVQGQQP